MWSRNRCAHLMGDIATLTLSRSRSPSGPDQISNSLKETIDCLSTLSAPVAGNEKSRRIRAPAANTTCRRHLDRERCISRTPGRRRRSLARFGV